MRIKRIANKLFQFTNSGDIRGLFILDNLFPSPYSPWRNYEFSELLKQFKESKIVPDLSNFYGYSKSGRFETDLEDLEAYYPIFKNRVRKLKLFTNISQSLVYVLFYGNIRKYFKQLKLLKKDFVFTLYPSGGFGLNHDETDKNLREICHSKHFKCLITNQNVILNYLIEKQICPKEKIALVFGVPLNFEKHKEQVSQNKDFYGKLKILFFGHKYMQYGFDKGFDLFQQSVLTLIEKERNLEFHVIGGFDEKDLMFDSLKGKIFFHGRLPENELAEVLNITHIVVSPNRAFAASPHDFDGFPLASSVTAGYFNNAMIMTDSLGENRNQYFLEGQDFLKINHHSNDICQKIEFLDDNRVFLEEMAKNGRKKIEEIYSWEAQIKPRIEIFTKQLK